MGPRAPMGKIAERQGGSQLRTIFFCQRHMACATVACTELLTTCRAPQMPCTANASRRRFVKEVLAGLGRSEGVAVALAARLTFYEPSTAPSKRCVLGPCVCVYVALQCAACLVHPASPHSQQSIKRCCIVSVH